MEDEGPSTDSPGSGPPAEGEQPQRSGEILTVFFRPLQHFVVRRRAASLSILQYRGQVDVSRYRDIWKRIMVYESAKQ
ncbi:hypothetical protein HPB48_007907 [Haemaphysalis longicornis]|uniref:Uncharacterized protein n=1 Tax=Haemaphysalis longicornis TaxID=44386 RepID=A0A9J6G8R8_HAELO|nr:hypothetical protein HPB48_007907 [Haemaphysalis longicornis]